VWGGGAYLRDSTVMVSGGLDVYGQYLEFSIHSSRIDWERKYLTHMNTALKPQKCSNIAKNISMAQNRNVFDNLPNNHLEA
jgi:hypothetical protein